MKTNYSKNRKKNTITTDLFSLIGAVADEVSQEEEGLIPEAVLSILNHNKITYINKKNKKTNH